NRSAWIKLRVWSNRQNTSREIGDTPILNAMSSGHDTSGIVQALLDNGARVNVTDDYGWVPLIQAASYNHLKIIRAMLEHGADVNMRDGTGRTALAAACEQASWEAVNLLM